MAEHPSSPGGLTASPEPPQPSPSPSEGRGGTPERKRFRSGYQREKYRRERLYAELDDLRLENAQLRQELAELDEAFREVTKLNSDLAGDLRQARRAPTGMTKNVGPESLEAA
jgi:hypothetical protein